jgi:hypothetical protein
MTNKEYQYDDNISVAKNIAIALFAIANEIGNLVNNNSDQSKEIYELLKKEMDEISNRIRNLTDTIKLYLPTDDKKEVHNEIQSEINIAPIVYYLDIISKNLRSIDKTIRKHFLDEDDEDYPSD